MSIRISENDIDHDEIVLKVRPDKLQDAVVHVSEALADLSALRNDNPIGRSNEVFRALTLVHMALVDCESED